MNDINLDDYKLNQEVLDLPDYVLELWYGKSGLFFISKLREINKIELNIHGNVEYNNGKYWVMTCTKDKSTISVSDYNILLILKDIYSYKEEQTLNIFKLILEQLLPNCKITKVW